MTDEQHKQPLFDAILSVFSKKIASLNALTSSDQVELTELQKLYDDIELLLDLLDRAFLNRSELGRIISTLEPVDAYENRVFTVHHLIMEAVQKFAKKARILDDDARTGKGTAAT